MIKWAWKARMHRDSNINKYLSFQEYACKCSYDDCTRILYYEPTAKSFYDLRVQFARAIMIGSAHRCQRHNSDVGGRNSSYHMMGQALDLQPRIYGENEQQQQHLLDALEREARKHFDYVQRYDEFIHCHNL